MAEEQRHRLATIGRVRFGRQSFDMMLRVRTVSPLIGVRPDAELKIEPAQRGLIDNELQGFEVAIALGVVERDSVNVVAGTDGRTAPSTR